MILVPILVPIFDRNKTLFGEFQDARVAELVDAPDLGSGSLGSEGSIPFARTIFNRLPVSKPAVSPAAAEFK